jgi:hypothetical protein
MQIIRPNAITEAMLLYCSIAEPDSINGETAWSSTEICAIGDERYIGSLSHSVTISTANPAVVTWANHGLAQDTPVVLSTTGTLPTGFAAGTTYFVSSVLSSSTFTLSASVGGRQIRATAGGSGTHTATAKVHKIFTAIAGQKATVTMTIASPGVVAYTAHGLSADTPIVFTTTGALPTGLTAGTTYYVKTVSDADHFTVAATVGGSAINTTGSQSGTHTCGLASNYNKPPLQYDDTVWTYLAPTNRWAMFDDQLGTVSSNADTLRVVMQPGRFNALALLETAASTVGVWLEINRATVTFNSTTDKVNYNAHGFAAGTQVVFWEADPTSDTLPTEIEEGTTYYVVNPTTNDFQVSATEGGSAIDLSGAGSGTRTCGELVYSRSVNLVDNSNVGNWYQYFYEPIYQKDTVAVTDIVDAALLDLPAYGEGVLTVQLDRSGGSVQCGALIPGLATDVGTLLDKPTIGTKSYSRVDRDEFGNVSITRRSHTKKMTCQIAVDRNQTDAVNALMGTYLDTAVVWVGDKNITSLVVFGPATDYSLAPESASLSLMSLEVEGMN